MIQSREFFESPIAMLTAVAIIVVGFIFVIAASAPQRNERVESEWYYDREQKKRFKSLQEEDEGSVYLTLVVPAYNEEDRMPAMLKETIEYLSKRQKKDKSFTYEFVIVDDGSKDKTYEIAMNESEKYGDDVVRVLKFEKNRGKGGAVRLGMEVARGKYILMVDADAATDINDLDRLEDKLKEIERDGYGIVVGSRAHMAEDESPAAQRSAFRRFLQKGFHFLVQFLGGVKGIHDTQCGFKLFTRKSAADVTRVLHLERWCFDVEALYIGQCLNMPLEEVAVNWQEIDGSKLDPTQAMIEMFKDLVTIKTYYTLGIWSIPKETLAHKRKVE